MKGFLKRNFMFVSLLSMIVAVTIGIGIYSLVNQEAQAVEIKPQEPAVEPAKEPSIAYLGADFKSGNTIRISWNIETVDQTISSVALYCNENKLADVDDLSYFEMPLGVYQFFGNVPFTLKVSFADGTTLEKSVSMQIPKVLSPKQSIEVTQDGVLLTFHYKYYKEDQIDIPTLYLMNTGTVAWDVKFESNQIEGQEGVYVNAQVVYRVSAKALSNGLYGFDVRYVFEEVSQSFNDRVEFEYLNEEVTPPETTPPDHEEETPPED